MNDWKNISLEFTEELEREWKNWGFSYETCKEWISIGLKPTEAEFAGWLITIRLLTPEEVLNQGSYDTLKQEFLKRNGSPEISDDETDEDIPSRPISPIDRATSPIEDNRNLFEKSIDLLKDWESQASGETKEELKWIVKKFEQTSNETFKPDNYDFKEIYQRIKNVATKFPGIPEFKGSVLEEWLTAWKDEEMEKGIDLEEEETIPLVPDWLISEEPEEKDKPKTKPPKTTKPPKPKEKPHECRICDKNTFYTKQEYIQAHGTPPPLEPSCWIYTKKQISKKPLAYLYRWLCKVCKQENHTNKCKYYSPPAPIIPDPEPFDWESYWKWWFGVNTLDWDSKRFFGDW